MKTVNNTQIVTGIKPLLVVVCILHLFFSFLFMFSSLFHEFNFGCMGSRLKDKYVNMLSFLGMRLNTHYLTNWPNLTVCIHLCIIDCCLLSMSDILSSTHHGCQTATQCSVFKSTPFTFLLLFFSDCTHYSLKMSNHL